MVDSILVFFSPNLNRHCFSPILSASFFQCAHHWVNTGLSWYLSLLQVCPNLPGGSKNFVMKKPLLALSTSDLPWSGLTTRHLPRSWPPGIFLYQQTLSVVPHLLVTCLALTWLSPSFWSSASFNSFLKRSARNVNSKTLCTHTPNVHCSTM